VFLPAPDFSDFIVIVDVPVVLVAEDHGKVRKHVRSETFGDAGGRQQVRTSVAFDQPHAQVSVDHEVPADHLERVGSGFYFVLTRNGDHTHDVLHARAHVVLLVRAVYWTEPLLELLMGVHALVKALLTLFGNCLIGQSRVLVVIFYFLLEHWKSNLKPNVDPRNKGRGRGDDRPYPDVEFAFILDHGLLDILLDDVLVALVTDYVDDGI